MNGEEPELRRALEARSGAPSSEFRARFASALNAGRPAGNSAPRLALAGALILTVAIVGVLMLSRQGGPRAVTPPMPTPTPIAMPTYTELSAPSDNVVWALVQNEYLARSVDRGAHWEQRPLPTWFGHRPPLEMSFVDDHEGWLIAFGDQSDGCASQTFALIHTTDAGETWTAVDAKGIPEQRCKSGLSFTDANHGFINLWGGGQRPTVYRTTDGGRTWTALSALPEPPGPVLRDDTGAPEPGAVQAFGDVLLLPVIRQPSTALIQEVFESTNGGAKWSYKAGWPVNGAFAFTTATRWIQLGGDNQGLETTDSGKTWHSYSSDYNQAAGVAPAMAFADSAVGYATVRGSIARTVDGGHHWVWITTPGT